MSNRLRGLIVIFAVIGGTLSGAGASVRAPQTFTGHAQKFIARDVVSFARNVHAPSKGRTAGGTTPVSGPGFAGPIGDGITFPGDPTGAVGTKWLMSAANNVVMVQDRTGATIFSTSLDGWWSGLGAIDVFGPTLVYDPYAGRWLFSAAADSSTPASSVLLATSDSADPTGSWHRYRLLASPGTLHFAEAPGLGFNGTWVVMQANMFNTTGSFTLSRLFVVSRLGLYTNAVFTAQAIDLGTLGQTLQPAVTYDMTIGTLYLMGAKTNGSLELFSMTGDVNTQIVSDLGQISSPSPWAFTGPGAPQAGAADLINVGDASLHRVVYRNGSLWTAHTVFVPAAAPTHALVQWWQVSTGKIVQQLGRIDCPNGTHANPTIAVNSESDVLIGFTEFHPTAFASAAYAYRNSGDPINTSQSLSVYKPGEAPYVALDTFGVNAWGHYSGAAVDPMNDHDLWVLQEYAASPIGPLDRWGTWWNRVSPTIGAGIGLSAAAIDFGSVIVGTTSATQTLTVTSTGNIALSIGAATIQGLQAPEFAIVSDLCSGTVLAQADTCQIAMNFTPAALGLRTASLRIPSNAPSSPNFVSLTGTGVVIVIAPRISFEPTSLDFGNVEVFTTKTLPLRVTNIGNASLLVGSIAINGLNPSDFSIPTDGCTGVSVAPNTYCLLQVSFTPPVLGLRRATMSLFSNVQAGVSTVNMFGVGVDLTAPVSTITTADGSLRIGIPLSIFDPYNSIEGTVTDAVSGVAKVIVRFDSTLLPIGGGSFSATLNCNALKTSCSWRVLVPLIPGLYMVTAQATDFSDNLEKPGPSINIIDI